MMINHKFDIELMLRGTTLSNLISARMRGIAGKDKREGGLLGKIGVKHPTSMRSD